MYLKVQLSNKEIQDLLTEYATRGMKLANDEKPSFSYIRSVYDELNEEITSTGVEIEVIKIVDTDKSHL